jgi:hypothetical protein
MSISVEAFTFDRLNAQPFTYDASNVLRGFSARKWSISGLATPSEWLQLLSVYDTWRDLKIEEDDASVSGVIGSTVTFNGTGPGGQNWTNIECWFASAPEGSQAGSYLNISFELIDANQSLEVILKGQESETASNEEPDFGTITIGSTVLTLKQPVDSYGDTPTANLTATGTHVISGPLVVNRIKDVVGTTDLTGWNNIRSWYESQIVAVPLTGSYFPVSAPAASAEIQTINGIKTTVYTVSITLAQIL